MAIDSKCIEMAFWFLRNSRADRCDRQDLAALLQDVCDEFAKQVEAREAERDGKDIEGQAKAKAEAAKTLNIRAIP
jgi:hypothetical protein